MKRIITIDCTPIGLLVVLLLNLLLVSERVAAQSDCRESLTRAHLTRCDKYFQCVVLPSQRIIWVSKQCAEGLVYDNDQGQCVVPDLNWECALGEESSTSVDDNADQENVYGVEDYLARSDESSGAGVEEEDDESLEEATTEYPSDSMSLASPERPDQEFSGDGTENSVAADSSTEAVEMPITPDQDGTVKSYLQRLTQLIDGFRKNGGSTATDITPDQLNSFVVMHKIKSNKNYDPSGTHVLPESGNILKPHLEYILKKQYSLNSVDPQEHTTTTTTTTTTASPVRRRIIHIIRPYHQPEPEDNTNIRVSSQLANGNETGTGSNSQIVVNRPEGSVLFNIARPASEGVKSEDQNRDPSFSQDTLKSVLELSKQLVAHQKYLSQKPNYLPPVVQPVYYTVPSMPMMQSANNQNYFNGEAVPVNPASNNKNASKPEKSQRRPVRIQNHIQNSGTYYEGQYHQIPYQQGYSRPNKYSTEDKHDQDTTQYVPLRPINPYEPQYQNNYNYNSNNQPPFGYYNSHLTDSHNHQNYNSGSQSGYNQPQDNHQYPVTYNPHRPPYYDASGLGQSSGNNYYNPSANYQNSQFSYNPPQNQFYFPNYYQPPQSHLNDEFEDEDKESAEYQEESQEKLESLESTEKPSTPSLTPEPKPSTPLSSLQQISQQLLLNNVGNKNKIVGINGNYMSFDTYKETIAPLLSNTAGGESNVEIVSCTLGVRQANASDCTRYYVCNPKDGQLLGYTCPPYTAFNELSRICDANSYAACNPGLITAKYTIQENKRLQYEAQKTLQEAKRIRDQALQAQYLTLQAQTTERPQFMDIPDERPILHKIRQNLKRTKPQPIAAASTGIGARPQTPLQLLGKRRKKYKCTDPGQAIPDVLSGHKYFVCVRDAAGKFKRRSMSCSKGLIFCSKRRKCTLTSRC